MESCSSPSGLLGLAICLWHPCHPLLWELICGSFPVLGSRENLEASEAPFDGPRMEGLGASWGSSQEKGLTTSLISESSNFCRVFSSPPGQAQEHRSLRLTLFFPHSLAGNQSHQIDVQIYWVCPKWPQILTLCPEFCSLICPRGHGWGGALHHRVGSTRK